MQAAKSVFGVICLLGLLLTNAGKGGVALAEQSARHLTVKAPFTEYEWWLMNWWDNSVLCKTLIDHDGMPSLDEVAVDCGWELANAWFATPSCSSDVIGECVGIYLYHYATTQREREVIVELPPPTAWIQLNGCSPTPPSNFCAVLPSLVLIGEEPLPEQRILSIQGTYDQQPFFCDGAACQIPLNVSPTLGSTFTFWVNSSYGDSSEHYTAQVRVIDTGVSPDPGGQGWYVDVISSQWRGSPLTSCGAIWEAFPPIGEPPAWLSTPDQFQLLASEEPYYYLAGRLIVQGLVDVSECAGGGLLPNGYSDVCGLEKARPVLAEWQNQFDQRIIQVSQETGVPAQLMKNLFAQESQFWPGVFRVPFEFGLGQITEKGADAVLIWNPDFYNQFCSLVFSQDACDHGYLGLSIDDQAILRGALAVQASADCKDCPTGIDLTNVHFTVSLFANTLVANCAQVSRSVYTATSSMAGRVASYEDLWRLTVANYHAGPGCTSYAIHTAWNEFNSLAWEIVAPTFTEACKGVVPYVEQISKLNQ